jgi:hypothetical protein
MTPIEIETYVDAASSAVGLRLRADHRPGVLRFFALAAEFAALVEAVPLTERDESAMSFAPVAPREKDA